jgi:hypothetical protein
MQSSLIHDDILWADTESVATFHLLTQQLSIPAVPCYAVMVGLFI